jgi:hypothetical protein
MIVADGRVNLCKDTYPEEVARWCSTGSYAHGSHALCHQATRTLCRQNREEEQTYIACPACTVLEAASQRHCCGRWQQLTLCRTMLRAHHNLLLAGQSREGLQQLAACRKIMRGLTTAYCLQDNVQRAYDSLLLAGHQREGLQQRPVCNHKSERAYNS